MMPEISISESAEPIVPLGIHKHENICTVCCSGLRQGTDPLRKKATIHQVTTMLTTSKNVLFPGQNHLLTTNTDDPSLAGTQEIIKVSGHQHRWLAGGYNIYDLEIGHF